MKKEAPKKYALAKARVLALGYGAGWKKFIDMAAMYIDKETFNEIFLAPVSEADVKKFKAFCKKYAKPTYTAWASLAEDQISIYTNSYNIVMDFRGKNTRITKLWKELDNDFDHHARHRTKYDIELPSGRCLQYFNLDAKEKGAVTAIGSPRDHYYGGKLVENLVQAVARDVFLNTIIQLEMSGYPVIWHVHDEVICETDLDADLKDFEEAFVAPPEWMSDLPIATEVEAVGHYKK